MWKHDFGKVQLLGSQMMEDKVDFEKLRTPMFCPICDFVMRDDPKVYYRWGACMLCFVEFIEHREERWDAGWRPSHEQVELFTKKIRP